jgi:hypothetical protein
MRNSLRRCVSEILRCPARWLHAACPVKPVLRMVPGAILATDVSSKQFTCVCDFSIHDRCFKRKVNPLKPAIQTKLKDLF